MFEKADLGGKCIIMLWSCASSSVLEKMYFDFPFFRTLFYKDIYFVQISYSEFSIVSTDLESR